MPISEEHPSHDQSRKGDDERPNEIVIRSRHCPAHHKESDSISDRISHTESSEDDGADEWISFPAQDERDKHDPCRDEMHEQSYYGLPERVAVAEDIQSEHADEEDEQDSERSRKPEQELVIVFFH